MLLALVPVANAGVTSGTSCASDLGAAVINTNVNVPAGALCVLNGANVSGNVSVGPNASILFINTVIKRTLSGVGAYSVNLIHTEVDGNTSFDGTVGAFSICDLLISDTSGVCAGLNWFAGTANPNPKKADTTKFGNVSITNTVAPAYFALNYVMHDLNCSGNSEMHGTGLNVVGGHATGQCADFGGLVI